MGISPAADRLPTRFLRRGVPLTRLRRPAPRIRPFGAATPARGFDVGIYGRIPVKSCYSDLAHRLKAGLMSLRASFGNVISDLRYPRIAGYPAGAAIVEACAGSGSRTGLELSPNSHAMQALLVTTTIRYVRFSGDRSNLSAELRHTSMCISSNCDRIFLRAVIEPFCEAMIRMYGSSCPGDSIENRGLQASKAEGHSLLFCSFVSKVGGAAVSLSR